MYSTVPVPAMYMHIHMLRQPRAAKSGQAKAKQNQEPSTSELLQMYSVLSVHLCIYIWRHAGIYGVASIVLWSALIKIARLLITEPVPSSIGQSSKVPQSSTTLIPSKPFLAIPPFGLVHSLPSRGSPLMMNFDAYRFKVNMIAPSY